jgi:hypothetical protein
MTEELKERCRCGQHFSSNQIGSSRHVPSSPLTCLALCPFAKISVEGDVNDEMDQTGNVVTSLEFHFQIRYL